MTDTITEKRCPSCGRLLPLEAFPYSKQFANSHGRHTYCKECHNAKSRESKARAREKRRQAANR